MREAERIQRDVLNELAWDPKVDSSGISVTADGHTVHLAGWVASYSAKVAAERAAQRIRSVEQVVNDIDVSFDEPDHHVDDDIAAAARDALAWNVRVPAHAVRIIVGNGFIELQGEVPWFYQRLEAERTVRKLRGVKGVTNRIVVRQPVEPTQVADRIREALERCAQIDAGQVHVETEGPRVTLSGAVRSWVERQQAELAAWSAPGVTEVVNELMIAAPVSVNG